MSHIHHRGPPAGLIPVPGGPSDYDVDDNNEYVPPTDIAAQPHGLEEESLRDWLCPDDVFTKEGTYWADLPLGQRIKFNLAVEHKEAMTELRTLGRMIKDDPLSPLGWYFRNCVIPGAGLLLEGYVLFSVSNVTSLLADVWPKCWGSKPTECNATWVQSVTYLEICGIIVGQILVGIIGDGIGRRWGLIQDAVIMFVGLLMLTAMWGTSLNGWVICYAWSLFFYSIGVGGEYPMTATAGMERKNFSRAELKRDRLHRGRRVVSAFLMQGWGQLLNQAILILGLLVFHHGSGNAPYSKVAVQWTFRFSFAVPAFGTLLLVYLRTYKMPGMSRELERAKLKNHVTGYDVKSLKLIVTVFGGRLIATCGGWFCNDFLFYGNKLFQSQFISAIVKNGGGKSKGVMLNWLYNLINIGCSLAGYYLASFTIDTKFWGRNYMQQLGFLMDFVLFVVPAFHYEYYATKHYQAFEAMYFLSSFFQQFGPNCVTFLVAAEVFPTSVRATAHGLAAASGKLGALAPAILYNYIDNKVKFHVVPWFGLAGMVLTLFFLPDTTGLDLQEQDRRWKFISEGRSDEYHGVAIHPVHLSLWERFRGVHKNYNPEVDYKQKVEELREEWEKFQAASPEAEKDSLLYEEPVEELSPPIKGYFARTSPNMSPMSRPYYPEEKDGDVKLPGAAVDQSKASSSSSVENS